MGLIKLAFAGAAGYALYKYATRDQEEPLAAAASNGIAPPPVRDAGPENMKSKPKRWSKTDEAIDESFPASDPPAH
jgi:hypothetical protein